MIYELAGLRVLIEHEHEYTTRFCADYLSPNQTSPCAILAKVSKEELQEERLASPNFSEGYIENICLYRAICRKMPRFSRFLLHSSVLEYEGNAYAFLGRSGTGKTTHTKLWLSNVPKASIVNGDKPLIASTDDGFVAYGTPWQGKEGWGKNVSAPLKGLCFLEQAKENVLRPLSASETLHRLFAQILLPKDEEGTVMTLKLVDELIKTVPSYLLGCDISEDAVKTSFEALTGKKYENR